MTYKNVALDHFLKTCLKCCPKMLRIGNSGELKEISLYNVIILFLERFKLIKKTSEITFDSPKRFLKKSSHPHKNIKRKFHDYLTQIKSVEKLLTQAGFELAPLRTLVYRALYQLRYRVTGHCVLI